MIDAAWQGVTTCTLNSAWKKLWPDCITERDFEGFDPEPGPEVVLDEIVSLGKSMGLEVDEGDIIELVQEHAEELTTEELKELQAMQQTEVLQEISSEEEEMLEKVTSTKEI